MLKCGSERSTAEDKPSWIDYMRRELGECGYPGMRNDFLLGVVVLVIVLIFVVVYQRIASPY